MSLVLVIFEWPTYSCANKLVNQTANLTNMKETHLNKYSVTV